MIDRSVRQGCIMSPLLFNVYMDSDERGENRDEEVGIEISGEWRLPALLYADDLVLCGESEDDLRAMMQRFVEVCRKSLKVNADKSKVMGMNGEEGLECDIRVDVARFKCQSANIWRCILDDSSTNVAECRRKVTSWRNQVQMEQNASGP